MGWIGQCRPGAALVGAWLNTGGFWIREDPDGEGGSTRVGYLEFRWFDKREIENPVGLGIVNEGKGFDGLRKEREESGLVDLREGQPRQGRSSNYERMQVFKKTSRCNAHDAMR